MTLYLCDICHESYYSDKLAKECRSRGIPNPRITSNGTWVKYNNDNGWVYGIVSEHFVANYTSIRDVHVKVNPHKLSCTLSPNIMEIVNQGDTNLYWRDSSGRKVLEERCVVLSPKEIEVINAIMSKVEFTKGKKLPSVDFLCQQEDFAQYLK